MINSDTEGYLSHTKSMAKLLYPRYITEWPIPDAPSAIQMSASLFMAHIFSKLELNPNAHDPYCVYCAIDEWLTTDDVYMLSPVQRMVCGCAAIELVPYIKVEIRSETLLWTIVENVAPYCWYAPPELVVACYSAAAELKRVSCDLLFNDLENDLLDVLYGILLCCSGRSANEIDWEPVRRVAKTNLEERDGNENMIIIKESLIMCGLQKEAIEHLGIS